MNNSMNLKIHTQCKKPQSKKFGPLSTEEIELAKEY